jgi:hypothetical protein
MKMILIIRISRKHLLEGTPSSLGLRPNSLLDRLLAGSREKLPDREKFHKRFFEKFCWRIDDGESRVDCRNFVFRSLLSATPITRNLVISSGVSVQNIFLVEFSRI